MPGRAVSVTKAGLTLLQAARAVASVPPALGLAKKDLEQMVHLPCRPRAHEDSEHLAMVCVRSVKFGEPSGAQSRRHRHRRRAATARRDADRARLVTLAVARRFPPPHRRIAHPGNLLGHERLKMLELRGPRSRKSTACNSSTRRQALGTFCFHDNKPRISQTCKSSGDSSLMLQPEEGGFEVTKRRVLDVLFEDERWGCHQRKQQG